MNYFLKSLILNLEGLIDMKKQDIYAWPEAEDDNIDFNAVHEANKGKSVDDLDQEWSEYIKNLKLETI